MTPAMAYRGGRTVRRSGRRPAGAGIAVAALVLTVAGCTGHVLPLGPVPVPTPVPRHLASAIVLQLVLSQPGEPGGGCPAGYATFSGPGTDDPGVPGVCYRKTGKPVTFTSAAVTLNQQPAGSGPVQQPAGSEPVQAQQPVGSQQVQQPAGSGPGQPAGYPVLITLPAAGAAALAAIDTKALDSQGLLAVIIAGQTWGTPFVMLPPVNGQFGISTQSRNQALQLQRILLQPA
jgi:hypothetical protein